MTNLLTFFNLTNNMLKNNNLKIKKVNQLLDNPLKNYQNKKINVYTRAKKVMIMNKYKRISLK